MRHRILPRDDSSAIAGGSLVSASGLSPVLASDADSDGARMSDAQQASTDRSLSWRRSGRWNAPLELADAEHIAAGWYAAAKPAPVCDDEGWEVGTDAADSAEWSHRFPAAAAFESAADDEVLDLPEPIEQRRPGWTTQPPLRPAQADHLFDYSVWSRELDDLLKQPLTPRAGRATAHEPSAGATSERSQSLPFVVTAPKGSALLPLRRRQSKWVPVLVLCASGIVMAAVIGGAAYGLASPQARSWLAGAGDLIDQLQIAVFRLGHSQP